jgi:hypothetical protein
MRFKTQLLPILITILSFLSLSLLLVLFLHFLNLFPIRDKIQFIFRPIDLFVGMTIYTKTSIDFALFMGNLMGTNPGWKKRIAINLGTALGNCLGTILILSIWYFLKEAPLLLIIMIILSSLVLFEMAEEGLKEVEMRFTTSLRKCLSIINAPFRQIFRKILPDTGIRAPQLSFTKLFFFSLTIPFLLGLDDFAGYIPLFSIVNVMSFVIGIFLAHTLLNIGLFASPRLTAKITNNPLVIILGSFAFVGIGLWGLIEATQIGLQLFTVHSS